MLQCTVSKGPIGYLFLTQIILSSMAVKINLCRKSVSYADVVCVYIYVVQQWQIREEQLTSSTWTCAKHLILSHTTSLSLKWKDMDLMGG